jgi:hypothetical protein
MSSNPEQDALALLQYLVDHAGWYLSAIELDTWEAPGALDGEELKHRAIVILEKAKHEPSTDAALDARMLELAAIHEASGEHHASRDEADIDLYRMLADMERKFADANQQLAQLRAVLKETKL